MEKSKTPDHIHEFSDLRDSQIGNLKVEADVPAVLRGSLSDSFAEPELENAARPNSKSEGDAIQKRFVDQERKTEFETWKLYYNLAISNILRSPKGPSVRDSYDAGILSAISVYIADESVEALKQKWKQLSEDSPDSSIPKT